MTKQEKEITKREKEIERKIADMSTNPLCSRDKLDEYAEALYGLERMRQKEESKIEALRKVYEKYKDFNWNGFYWGDCDDGSCNGYLAIEMLYEFQKAIKNVFEEK